jgi:hypothetical protein
VIWIPIGAWLGAAAVALVVLGFCAYELLWKSRRLQGDLRELAALAVSMQELQAELVAARARVSAAGLR